MAEEWRPVVGFEGLYEVSDRGRVRSLDRTVPSRRVGQQRRKGRILKPGSNHGYQKVSLQSSGRRQTENVHRLVLQAFVGPCPPGFEACHRDDDKTNNNLQNLRWDTRSANGVDKVRNGRNPNKNKTHCPKGHPYSPENTYLWRTMRRCRACASRRAAALHQRNRKLKKEQAS